MAVLYLDDSGSHNQSPIMTMAGYLFSGHQLELFERRASRFLRDQKVPEFHAKVFDKAREAPFKKWGPIKQTAFAHEWFAIAKEHAVCGLASSLPKEKYDLVRKEFRANQNISVFGQCFNGILADMASEADVWSLVEREGLSVILEAGNKHNAGVIEFFKKVRDAHNWQNELRQIGECQKKDCVAIQLADYLAFYAWRYALDCTATGMIGAIPSFLNIATAQVRTIAQLGDDFVVDNKKVRKRTER